MYDDDVLVTTPSRGGLSHSFVREERSFIFWLICLLKRKLFRSSDCITGFCIVIIKAFQDGYLLCYHSWDVLSPSFPPPPHKIMTF